MPILVYCDVDGVDRAVELGDVPVVVGRAADCVIRSDDPRMSRMHARFTIENGLVWVEDLGSANGVWLGPQRVSKAPVPPAEVVVVGSLLMQVHDPSMPGAVASAGAHTQLSQWLAMERKSKQVV